MYKKLLEIIEEEKETVKERLRCIMPDFFVRGVIEYVTDLVTKEYFTETVLNDPTYTIDELQTVLESKYRELLERLHVILGRRGGIYDRAVSMATNYLYCIYDVLRFYIENMDEDENEKE